MISNIWKFIFTLLLSFLVFIGVGYAYQEPALLDGELLLSPDMILPGTSVNFTFKVRNVGSTPSPQGEIAVRYALIHPLSQHPKNILFTTEKQPFPSIDPEKEIVITFTTPQKLPSVIDFVREDWLLYEYQVVFIADGKEKVLMTLPLTFSVHYYPVFRDEHSLIELSS